MSQAEDESQQQFITREGALEIARANALRNLIIDENSISYVAFVNDFQDYCLCEFKRYDMEDWAFSVTMLPHEQRLPAEQISDARIVDAARSGNMLLAIRLYRGKYDATLESAKLAIRSLLDRPG